ncbi:hypothetical protein WA158_006658 [Blastocystis sp. Blastoise]
MAQGGKDTGGKEKLVKTKKPRKVHVPKKYVIAAKKPEAVAFSITDKKVTKEIGKNIESIAAYKAVSQIGDKIKLSDVKSKGKNKLQEIRDKIKEEEDRKKKRYEVKKTEESLGDEFDADLLW